MEEDGDCRRMVGAEIPEESEFHVMLLEPRPFRPFKSSEEYLYAMKEDLAEWLNSLYGLQLTADDFMEQMETGVILCRHANKVMHKAREYYSDEQNSLIIPIPDRDVVYRSDVLPGTFHARDNISNFISWCRALAIKECLLFETDDLVLRKNERSFILCLLEVARRGAKFGMPAPLLVQMEQEIDAELANDDGYETVHAPPQIVTNDLLSLHERVVQLLSRCTCPSQFPMIRVADGKYRIGDTKVLIFVRILRSHVMVRVGGGWDTLEHYLDKHDPCRCKSGHRLATSAKLTMQPGKNCAPNMHVTYSRPPQAPSSTPTSPQVWRRCIAVPSILDRRSSNPDIEVNHPVGDYSRITQFSDDSSASNTSLHVRDESPENQSRAPFHYADSSSEGSDGECCNQWNIPNSQRKMRMLRPKDTVPSSWKYTPSLEVREQQRAPLTTSPVLPRRRERESLPNIWPREGRIPPPSTKSKIRAPQITRLNSDNSRTKWTDQRSQSSENLYQNKPPVQKPLVFHSRGSSPVNVKNRTLSGTGQYITPPQRITPIKNKERGNVFQRAEPIRNSNRSRKSPEVSPKRAYVPRQRNQQPTITQDSYPFNRVGSVQDRSTVLITDHHGNRSQVKSTTFPEKALSPLLEKLLQDTDLGSDEKILKRMEMLINEYKTKMGRKQQPDDRMGLKPNVLSVDSSEGLVSDATTRYRSRSPNPPNIKSPSKIPVPKSYRKC